MKIVALIDNENILVKMTAQEFCYAGGREEHWLYRPKVGDSAKITKSYEAVRNLQGTTAIKDMVCSLRRLADNLEFKDTIKEFNEIKKVEFEKS